MIKKYSLKVLQKAINQTISLDEYINEKIKPLLGKVIEIIIAPLEVNFFIVFNETTIELLDSYEGQADTIIQSNPLGLIRLSFLPASQVRSLFNDKIRISGDIEVGEQVKKLFDQLDIDWEGHLAYFTGDIAAYQISSIVKKGLTFQRQLTQIIRQNISEYIQEEVRLFPPKEEINDFFNDIDQLVQDVDRLEARIHFLVKSYEAS